MFTFFRKDKDIKAFTEQMENAAQQLSAKLPDVQASAKNEAERLGHAINSLISYFDPLVNNAIGKILLPTCLNFAHLAS